MRDYPRLSIEDFGAHLLESGDLDPVYIALHKCEWPEAKLNRWLLGYWSTYHCGVASWLAEKEGQEFWTALREVAENEAQPPVGVRYPRGSERRHWRGENARKSVRDMWGKYFAAPEQMVNYIAYGVLNLDSVSADPRPLPYKTVNARVKEHNAFGDWIAFKVADMLDRLDIVPVDFSGAGVMMWDDPRKAALMLARKRMGLLPNVEFRDERAVVANVVSHLTEHFAGFQAPPLQDRPVGLQEVETILCKWKSHMNGHYPLNNDIHEIYKGTLPWVPVSQTAQEFVEQLPKPLIN